MLARSPVCSFRAPRVLDGTVRSDKVVPDEEAGKIWGGGKRSPGMSSGQRVYRGISRRKQAIPKVMGLSYTFEGGKYFTEKVIASGATRAVLSAIKRAIDRSIRPSIPTSIHPSIHPSLHPSIHPSIHGLDSIRSQPSDHTRRFAEGWRALGNDGANHGVICDRVASETESFSGVDSGVGLGLDRTVALPGGVARDIDRRRGRRLDLKSQTFFSVKALLL